MALASNLHYSHIFVLVGNLLQACVTWDGSTDCKLNDWLYDATLRRFLYKDNQHSAVQPSASVKNLVVGNSRWSS